MNLALNNQTMSSREIAELTGKQVKHIHRDFKIMARELDFPLDGVLMPSPDMDLGFSYEKDDQGRISAINMNQELTLTLVSGYNVKLRSAIIKRWKELEELALKPQLPNFSDPVSAARAWADEFEQKQIAQQQLAIAAPKVEFHDKLVNNESSYCIRDAAKSINQRPNKLKAWLRDNKYLCMNNLPMQ